MPNTQTTDSSPDTATSGDAPAPRPRPRTVVAALWLYLMLNYLYCDVLGLHDPSYLKGVLSGSLGGISFNQSMLLASSVLMTIPMVAVLASMIAPHRFARWYSVIAAIVMALVQVVTMGFGEPPTLYYLYFSVIEVAVTLVIAWYALRRWRHDS